MTNHEAAMSPTTHLSYKFKQHNKHSVGCEAQLAWKCLLTTTFWRALSTCKVGQTDMVFGMRSGIISTSVHARLQVSVCSGYDLFHPDEHQHRCLDTHTHW